MNRLVRLLAIASSVLMLGCTSPSPDGEHRRGDKTREIVAKATRETKPELKWSARKLGAAAEWVADETLAAMEGFVEGWFSSSVQPVNVNAASERQLETLPGVTPEEAHRIIRSRPYRNKRELLSKGIISASAYARIDDHIATD